MRTTLPANISEDAFEDLIIEYARIRHWLVHVERRARSEKGWRTPIKGDKGWPDFVAARHGQLVIAELKSQRGRLSSDQERWIENLDAVAARWPLPVSRLLECHLWRPSDWPQILEILK